MSAQQFQRLAPWKEFPLVDEVLQDVYTLTENQQAARADFNFIHSLTRVWTRYSCDTTWCCRRVFPQMTAFIHTHSKISCTHMCIHSVWTHTEAGTRSPEIKTKWVSVGGIWALLSQCATRWSDNLWQTGCVARRLQNIHLCQMVDSLINHCDSVRASGRNQPLPFLILLFTIREWHF